MNGFLPSSTLLHLVSSNLLVGNMAEIPPDASEDVQVTAVIANADNEVKYIRSDAVITAVIKVASTTILHFPLDSLSLSVLFSI